MVIEEYEQARTEAIVTGAVLIVAAVVAILYNLYDIELIKYKGYAISMALYSAGVGACSLLINSQMRTKYQNLSKCSKDIVHLMTLTWMAFIGSVLFLIMALMLMLFYKYYIIV